MRRFVSCMDAMRNLHLLAVRGYDTGKKAGSPDE